MSWRVTCIPRRFEWLKRDDGFATLVALGRCLNQLRFAMYALGNDNEKAQSNSFDSRQATSAMFAIAAALYEGIELARRHVGKHYRGYREYGALSALWRGANNAAFISDVKRLRDTAVSHFDPTEVRKALETLSFADECVFVEGHESLARDLHCKLADGVAWMTYSGHHDTYEELAIHVEQLRSTLAAMSGEFMTLADAFLGRVLSDYGFTLADDGHGGKE